jgi:hypothetical protein
MAEAIALAKELKDMHGLAVALNYAAVLGYLERNPTEVEGWATVLIELSTRQNFAFWLAQGAVYRGWARSASGDTVEGISWIHNGIEDFQATGSALGLPFFLMLKAGALYLAERVSESLEAIREAEALAKENSVRLVQRRTPPAPRCGSRWHRRQRTSNWRFVCRSHQHCEAAEIGFAGEPCRCNIRRIP